jgi:predicted nucleic acid-binding protein
VILVDSNVLIDILDNDPRWHSWSMPQLEKAAGVGPVFINHVILAEVAPHHGNLASFHAQLDAMMIEVRSLTDDGAFASGLAFLEYRKRRHGTNAVLADFLIGGHAQSVSATLLTRDPRFYRSYFPDVPLITPDRENS